MAGPALKASPFTPKPSPRPRRRGDGRRAGRRARGVTLVELVVVLTIVAVVASIGATMTGRLVAGRQAQRARLVLAQQADAAVGRLADGLATALPNSVRLTVNAAGVWIEWVPVIEAGRYRQAPDTVSATPGDPLDGEDPADNSFDVIGVPLATAAAAGEVVFANSGLPEADVYAGSNRRAGLVLSNGNRHLRFTAAGALPPLPPQARFFIVGTPVTTACVRQGDGSYHLLRHSGYGWRAAQPVSSAALAGATAALELDGLADCSAAYGSALANIGLLTLRLQPAADGGAASMALLHQFAVDNTP